MGQDWVRVGRYIAARIDELKLTKAEAIRRTGVSDKTLSAYIAGEPIIRADKKRGICDGLRWGRHSIELIASGQEPNLLPELDPEVDRRLTVLEDQMGEFLSLLRAAGIAPGGPA